MRRPSGSSKTLQEPHVACTRHAGPAVLSGPCLGCVWDRQHCPEKGLSGDCRGKSRLQIHVLIKKSTFSICALSVEWVCPFLVPHQARGDYDDSTAWYIRSCMTGLDVKDCAHSVSLCFLPAYWSDEKLLMVRSSSKVVSSFVIALPAGFSLCTTAIFEWVVRAGHASRNVRERIFPAPKTPATARVDLPDRNAKAKLEAREAMCPLSYRAAAPRALAKVAACGQYVSVSPVASIRNRARRLCRTTIVHSR